MSIAKENRVFRVERKGKARVRDPVMKSVATLITIPLSTESESGSGSLSLPAGAMLALPIRLRSALLHARFR